MPSDPALILGFDTSAAHCAAALLSGDRIVAHAVDHMAKGQAERLIGLLQEVLTKGGVTWQDLDAIGTGVGPGNFTGIRISVAAARGLALGLNIPAVGVSSFEAMAFDAALPVIALVPAPRDQVYRQDISAAENSAAFLQPRTDVLREAATRGVAVLDMPPADQLVANIARIAGQRWQGPRLAPAPLYVRAADAAPARDAPPVLIET